MRSCMQFADVDVLQHGVMVTEAFSLLKTALSTECCPEGWRVPQWLLEHKQLFLDRLLPEQDLFLYQKYHDCGKPYCRKVDETGRVHFPDHAQWSQQVWEACGGGPLIGRLMRLDMAMHLASAEELDELAPRPEAASLYLTALAEVHANAPMFGGFSSPSFLAKVKHLDRRGKRLVKHWSP
jgi:hypothetical protein